MTGSENHEQLQARVIDYLYGDLSAEARDRFERELANNDALQRIHEEEQRLNSAVPPGTQPCIDEERLQGNRWLLRQRLQRDTRSRWSLQQWLAGQREQPLKLFFQGAAMAMTFILGIMVASIAPPGGGADDPAVSLQRQNSPLDLVNTGDYEIYQLRVNDYDVATGNIDLSFSLASDTRVTGNVADRNIHQLMAVALQDDIGSAARLDTINALHPVRAGNDVYEALIHVLINDENPGVRYQAVQALADLADQERVREALRIALSQDMNPGVRVQAFNALLSYRDERTLEVFRQQMETDSNEYIRTQARSIVEGTADTDDRVL